jgi:hypothetical protein
VFSFIFVCELIEFWDGTGQLKQFAAFCLWLLHIKATVEKRFYQTTLRTCDEKETNFLCGGGALLRFHRNRFFVSFYCYFILHQCCSLAKFGH